MQAEPDQELDEIRRAVGDGAEADIAKFLASTSWEAANVWPAAHRDSGFAAEYDLDGKVRQAPLALVAPVSKILVQAHFGRHTLGLRRFHR